MPVSDELLARTRKLETGAVVELLESVYPSIHRIAYALTGTAKEARLVLVSVVRNSITVMPKWRTGALPDNWFYHHTLLASRSVARPAPDPQADPLVQAAAIDDPGYVAFIRALRKLPAQQAEAFILNHGERLNARLLGVAMDCSMDAAANHLRAADSALQEVSGGSLATYTATLARAYTSLTPPPDSIHPVVQMQVKGVLYPRRLKRALRLLAWLVLLCGIGFALWHWRAEIARLMPTSNPL